MFNYNKTVNIVVAGAAGRIGYSTIFRLAAGDLFGDGVTVNLRLLEVSEAIPSLMNIELLLGVQLELEECNFNTLGEVIITEDPDTAFGDADYVFMMGTTPPSEGMNRSDLLINNAKIFAEHGRSIGNFAHPDVKVLVVGHQSNTNTLVALHNAPELNHENFSGMMQLDVSRAKSIISNYCVVPHTSINGIVIWGNHSTTLYPDLNHAQIKGIPSFKYPGITDNWYIENFIPEVQNRDTSANELLVAASAANAAIQQMKMWISKGGSSLWDSIAVLSSGQYGIESDLIFSFPIRHAKGRLYIVNDLDIDEYSMSMIKLTEAELIQERDIVKKFLFRHLLV
jgi:malate dehydrogenase